MKTKLGVPGKVTQNLRYGREGRRLLPGLAGSGVRDCAGLRSAWVAVESPGVRDPPPSPARLYAV